MKLFVQLIYAKKIINEEILSGHHVLDSVWTKPDMTQFDKL
jgi:hypothetical protein